MRLALAACSVVVLSNLALAHETFVRPGVRLDSAAVGHAEHPSVDAEGDLVAAAWKDEGDHGIYVSLSDGRGVSWSAPVRVDGDTTGAEKHLAHDAVRVAGGNVYVAWLDDRHDQVATAGIETELYVAHSVAGVWGPEVRVGKASPAGSGTVEFFSWDVQPIPAVKEHIWIAFSVDPLTGGGDELYFAASHNAGVSFNAPVVFSTGPYAAVDVDDVELVSCASDVHVSWIDDRSGAGVVYYQHSPNDGNPGTWLAADVPLSSGFLGAAVEDVEMGFDGRLLASVWTEDASGAEALVARVSADAGATFSVTRQVGGYVAGTHDAHHVSVDVDSPTRNVIVAWEDDRSGSSEVYAAVSRNRGGTWLEAGQLSIGGGGHPLVVGARGPDGHAFVAFEQGSAVAAAASDDGGEAWEDTQLLSDPAASSDHVSIAHSPSYGNLVAVYLSDPTGSEHVYSSGFRSSRVDGEFDGSGGQPGHFELGFPGSEPFAWVVAAGAPGSFPLAALGDPRDLGLAFDPLFSYSIADPTYFFVALDAGGEATTTPLPNSLPVGYSFYAAGVSFDITGTLGALTDATPVTVE